MSDADRVREKLRDLRRAADHALAPELQSRLAQHIGIHGPAIVRRSRRRRAWLKAGTLLLPIALGAGWAATHGIEGGAPERAANAPLQASSGEPRACARPLDAPSFTALPSGRRWIDLGPRGRIVLDENGEAELDVQDPCRLELRLTRGRVTVHAANLLGGEFRVRASETDVVVHGTVFAVERAGQELSVDVDEGRVLVERSGRAVAPLVRGGERLRVDSVRTPVLLALSESSRLQLRAAVSEPAATLQPSSPSEAALDEELRQRAADSAKSDVATQPSDANGDLDADNAHSRIAGAAAANVGRYRRTSTADLETDAASEDVRTAAQGTRPRSSSESSQPRAAGRTDAAAPRTTRSRGSGSSSASERLGNARVLAQASDGSRAATPAGTVGGAASMPSREAATATPGTSRSIASGAQPPASAAESHAPAHTAANDDRPRSADDATSPISERTGAPGKAPAVEPSSTPSLRVGAAGLGAATREQATAVSALARESASTLLARADGLWRRGERDEARALYQRAGADSGPTAQAAWLALARRELSARDADAAREALASYSARFPHGALSEEAAGIAFRVALLDGDESLAEQLAKRLLDRHPGTSAAKAAARWLRARGAAQ